MHDIMTDTMNEETLTSVLDSLGIDVTDENFIDTPARWLKFLRHYVQPYNPASDLETTFSVKAIGVEAKDPDRYARDMVVQTGIPYRAVCAHHLLPVLGTAHVAYIPQERVVGISKLARVVYGYSHATPSLQEHVCNQVASALNHFLKPLGAICVIEAEHGCMACRGVEEAAVATITSSLHGVFRDNDAARAEFYSLISLRHGQR